MMVCDEKLIPPPPYSVIVHNSNDDYNLCNEML